MNFRTKAANFLMGTRTFPTLFHPSWYTFVAIRKFLEDSVEKYRSSSDKKTLRVLDFGCGDQPYRYIFAADEYSGCDIGNSPELNAEMSVITEGANLPYESHTFDVILCTEVIEHLKDAKLYAGEFYRILKPGGQLIITVPQIWNYHPYPEHYYLYTPGGLSLLFSEKFQQLEMYSDPTPFQTGMMIAMMYSDWKIPVCKIPYIFLTNFFILLFPKYQKYSHAGSHIFVNYLKK